MRAKDYLLVSSQLDHDKDGREVSRPLQVAVTAILCEMAHVDENLDRKEYELIIRALTHQFHLMDEEAEELREIACVLIEDKAKVDEFLDEINEHFNEEQRMKICSLVEAVAEADGLIDSFETLFGRYVRERLKLPS